MGYYFRKNKNVYKLFCSYNDSDGPVCEGTKEEVLKSRAKRIMNKAKLDVIELMETFPEGLSLSGKTTKDLGYKTTEFLEWNLNLYKSENYQEDLDKKYNEVMEDLE